LLNKVHIVLLMLLCSTGFADISFGPEVRIDSHPDPYTTGGTDIVMLPSGRVVVTWYGADEEYGDNRLWSAYSDDFGVSWSTAIPVSDENSVIPRLPIIASDSSGILYAIWEDWRGPDTYAAYFSRSDDSGESWLFPNVRINDYGEMALEPGIASNPDGSILVSVFDRLNENRIYGSFSIDGGYTWSPDLPVGDDTPGGQYYPVVECTGDKSFVVLWNDRRDTISYVYSSVSEDGGQTWSSPNTPVPCGGHEPLEEIDLRWDGAVLHAFWIESYGAMDAYFIDEAYYSRSTDGGYTWLEDPVRVDEGSPNTWRRYGGIWASDPANIYAVWCSIWNQSYPIYAVLSISSDSGKTWSDTLRTNPVSGEAFRCDITGDVSTGQVIVTWDNQINQYIMCSTGYDNSGVEPIESSLKITVSRNPFTGSVSFSVKGELFPEEISVFDSMGRLVGTLPHSGSGQYHWVPSENIPPGVYFARGSVGDLIISARVVLLN
jgi:hypothetical protein